MATVTLGSKAAGRIVKLNEGGEPVEFYIAKQNYESGLNGSGRTLLVRKDCYDKRKWHISNVNAYDTSDIDDWLNSTYKNLLDPDIQAAMGTTKFYYTPGNGKTTKTTLERSVFLLSATELGKTDTNFNAEGTALSSTVLNLLKIAYIGSSTVSQWTRSPRTDTITRAVNLDTDGSLSSYNTCTNTSGSRPVFTLPSTLYVSDDGSVIVNTAPSTPASISVPSDISGGTTITVSWAASTDAEGNLAGYVVEKSVNGGSDWTEIYRAQSAATSTQDNVAFGTASVMYRVKAFDTEGLESGWRVSADVPVVNNRAPTAPASITVPLTVNGGAGLTVSWDAATDSDGNLSGYELERQYNGGNWEQIYRGDKLAFTDSITKGWETVAYRVRAYDDLGVTGLYKTSDTRAVNNNTAPTVTCAEPSGSDLGTKSSGFTVDYSVDDTDGDAVTVTEAIDGVVKRGFAAELGQNHSFQVTGDYFQKVLNGRHTLTITADDSKAATVHKLTFTKEVTKATITLETPMDADAEITLAILSVMGSIPADAEYKVEVTSNGKDDTPEWQDVTAEVKAGINIVFENHTADNGFAFNFRVTVERGESGQGGYITSIQGGFQ